MTGAVEVRDVARQPRLGGRQHVRDARGAQQDQRGVRRPDAGQLPQFGERVVGCHRREPRRVELPVERRPRDRPQPRHAVGGHAGQRVRGEQPLGQRERGHLLARDGTASRPSSAQIRVRTAVACARYRLALMIDQAAASYGEWNRTGRSQSCARWSAPITWSRSPIAAHGPPGWSRDRMRRTWRSTASWSASDSMAAVTAPSRPLRQVNGRVVAQVIGDERQPHLAARQASAGRCGPEPERGRRREREGPVRDDGEGAHAHRYRPGI